jgi:hypothetical protein
MTIRVKLLAGRGLGGMRVIGGSFIYFPNRFLERFLPGRLLERQHLLYLLQDVSHRCLPLNLRHSAQVMVDMRVRQRRQPAMQFEKVEVGIKLSVDTVLS